MPHLHVCVLGSLQIQLEGRPVSLESDKARALLAYLTAESDRPHRRETLVGLLWPDSPEELARGNLRQALYSLRQAIGDARANPPYLLINREEIQFNTASDCALDLAVFEAKLAEAGRHSHAQMDTCPFCAGLLEQAIARYQGKFLEQFFLRDSVEFEEWALMQRESLHRRALEALEHLAGYHMQNGQYEQAARWSQRQLELDPWREEAHRQLMAALAAAGQRSTALMQYEICRKVLRDELGVEPSAETRELYEQISRGELVARRDEQAAANRLAAAGTPPPLPKPLTPFLGRERELSDLAALLKDAGCRLITLVGPGGMGKTRLALEAAALCGPAFRDGAAFVSLASAASTAAILPAIAGALGLAFFGPADPQAQLTAFLQRKQMLVVLDNLEHLLDAAGLWVEILQAAPEVKLLATSREPLNLQGEWVFEVEGLPLPAQDQMENVEASAAAALFLQRARRARVGFELCAEERPAVARLCYLVGGMPLALELAATWVRTLSCSEIAQEIEGSPDFLAAPVRDLEERHRSVRAVFDQSWEMLAPGEQRSMARLSAFRGGFGREAAAAIAGASLAILSALVAKSLLRRAAGGRYTLHELVRQYAASRLAADPVEERDTLDRHSAFYLDWLGRHDAALRSGSQKAVLAELTAEMDNLRAAWDHEVARGEITRVYRVSPTLWYLYAHHNWFQEGETLFRRAAETLQARLGREARTDAERAAGQDAVSALMAHSAYFAFSRGKSEEAHASLSPSAAHLRARADSARPMGADAHAWAPDALRASAYALWYLGICQWGSGAHSKARISFSESLARAREAQEPYYEAAAGTFLGVIEHELGEYCEARQTFTTALAVARPLGDVMLLSHLLTYSAETALALAEQTEAEKLLRESLALARDIGCLTSEGLALDGLGQAARVRGANAEARGFLAAAARIFREIASAWNLLRVLRHQAFNSLALGSLDEAKECFLAVLRIAQPAHLESISLEALAGLTCIAALQQHDPVEDGLALEIAMGVIEHPGSTEEARKLAEDLRARVEANATSEQMTIARVQASISTVDELAQHVLRAASHAAPADRQHL